MSFNLHTTRIVLAAFAGSLVGVTAHAQVLNGNFDSGLASWFAFGDAGVVSGSAYLTTASLYDDDYPALAAAFNSSGISADLAGVPGGLEEATGLTIGALDLDASNFAAEGSGLRQTFSVNAGDTLSFDYQFFTNEGSMLDFAYFTINGALIKLAEVADAASVSSPFAYQTSVLTATYHFLNAETITLGFGVVDIADFGVTSALSIDNITVIPEPSTTVAVMATGVLALVASRRRRAAAALAVE